MNQLLPSKTKLECSSETISLQGLIALGRMSRTEPSWDLSILKSHSAISHQALNLHVLSCHLQGQATYTLDFKLQEHASGRLWHSRKKYLQLPPFHLPLKRAFWNKRSIKKTAVEGTAAIHTVSGTIQLQHLLSHCQMQYYACEKMFFKVCVDVITGNSKGIQTALQSSAQQKSSSSMTSESCLD